MKNYRDVIKSLKKYKFLNRCDSNRRIGSCGWSDIQFTPIDKNMSINSKYIINIDQQLEGEEIFLYRKDLAYIRKEMQERFIEPKKSYDEKRNRVFTHYIGNGKLLFGNKLDEHIILQFEELKLNNLIKKINYESCIIDCKNNEKHQLVQSLVVDLGVDFNLNFKVANNDVSKKVNNINFKEFSQLTNKNIDLISLFEDTLVINKERLGKESIDIIKRIDVLWINKILGVITDAFEIELPPKTGGFQLALNRLDELEQVYEKQLKSIRLVIVSDSKNKNKVEKILKTLSYKNKFHRNNLYFLSIQNLIRILDEGRTPIKRERMYFDLLEQFKVRNLLI